MNNEPKPTQDEHTVGSALNEGLGGDDLPSFEDVQIGTLELIRSVGSRLNELPDEHIKKLFHEWSTVTMAANWLLINERGAKVFVKWATTAPCDDDA